MKHGKHSVRVKMIVLTFAAIFGTVALCVALNNSLLVKYYEKSKQKTLGTVYEEIDRLMTTLSAGSMSADGTNDENEADVLSEEQQLELDILCTKSNVTAVIGENLSRVTNPRDMIKYYFGSRGEKDQDAGVIMDLIGDYYFPGFGQKVERKELELATEDYSIFSLYDSRMKSKYIELVGFLRNGDIILMRSNVESMQESVTVANKFLIYAGLTSAFVISVIMFFVGRRFTRPILKLAELSKEMSELNFDVKYEAESKDEFDTLGKSMNVLSEKLERTISELKSANNELQVDIERKTRAEEVRKEFLSNVTHELKTPIALIQGYAEGLKDNINESPEEREFYCDVIIDEAAKMNTLVKKLLTLNQLEYGTAPLEFARFDLTAVIRAVLDSTEILAAQKEVSVSFSETEPVYVWADEYMVEEVLTNYISNAFHHADGEKRIEVKVVMNGDRVRISVFNTGAQIPEEDIDNIWIKFYKVDKARTREYGGSGIGLSIVKAIMEAHNRSYGVKNHASGVEFWFELDHSAESQN